MSSDRAFPHSLEAEKVALGAVLVRSEAWAVLASVVSAEDFYRSAHQQVFRSMSRLAAKGTPVDLVTLKNDLAAAGELDSVGGPSYLAGLTEGVPTSLNVAHYAGIVREKAELRKLVSAGRWLVETAMDAGEQPAASIADEAAMRLMESTGKASGGLVTDADAITRYVEQLIQGSLGDPVMSGYYDVDRLLGGFKPCDLVIVAARPSVGKSSWALGVAEAAAAAGKVSLFFTLEMTAQGMASRQLSWRTGTPALRLERGEATDEEYRQVVEIAARPGHAVPVLYQETARTITEVSAWARRAQQLRGGIGLVVVDYLQLLVADRPSSSRQEDVAAISRGLKRLAKDLKVPVLALSQLSRSPEDRRDKRPQLSDLRDSGALEQDADMAILLFREEMHKPKPENEGQAEVIVAKNRNGATGVVHMRFDKSMARFQSLAQDQF